MQTGTKKMPDMDAGIFCINKKRARSAFGSRLSLVEHTGFEPVTPTLPVLCAPSCANAPCSAWSERYYFNGWIRICQ